MKASTARQMLNAEFDTAPAAWVVKSGFVSTSLGTSQPMTYRQALAAARRARESGAYAMVERAA